MDLPWNDIAKIGGGGGLVTVVLGAVYFGARYLRTKNGKAEPEPEFDTKEYPRCVAEPVLNDVRVQGARTEESFKGLCHSIDGMAREIRDNTREQKAVVGSLLNAYLKKEGGE